MALLASFMQTERGLDVSNELRSRGRRFRLWVVSIIVSVIVMGSSASSYDAKCQGEEGFNSPKKYCRRAAFGVSAGCVGCVFSLAVVAIRLTCTKTQENGEGRPNKNIFVAECISSVVLLCFYCFAVAYLTSEEGPGAPLGNIFYSTWGSFGVIFFIATSCFEEYQAAKLVRRRMHEGGDVSEGEASSLMMDRPLEPLADNEDYSPVELNQPGQNGTVAAFEIMPASVGEVSIAD